MTLITNPGEPAYLYVSQVLTSTHCTTQVTSPAASRAASSSTHATSLTDSLTHVTSIGNALGTQSRTASLTHVASPAVSSSTQVTSRAAYCSGEVGSEREDSLHLSLSARGCKDEVVSGEDSHGRAPGVVGEGVECGSPETRRQGSTDGGGGGRGGGEGEGGLRLDTRLSSPSVCLVSSSPTVCLVSSSPMSPVGGWGGDIYGLGVSVKC